MKLLIFLLFLIFSLSATAQNLTPSKPFFAWACCKRCQASMGRKACSDRCISQYAPCTQGPGCACNASDHEEGEEEGEDGGEEE